MLLINARVKIQSVVVFNMVREIEERGRFHVFGINIFYHNPLPLINVLQPMHGVAFRETERTSVQVIGKLEELL